MKAKRLFICADVRGVKIADMRATTVPSVYLYTIMSYVYLFIALTAHL